MCKLPILWNIETIFTQRFLTKKSFKYYEIKRFSKTNIIRLMNSSEMWIIEILIDVVLMFKIIRKIFFNGNKNEI